MNADFRLWGNRHQNYLGGLGDRFLLGLGPDLLLEFFLVKNNKLFAIVNLNSESRFVLRISWGIWKGLRLQFRRFFGLSGAQDPLGVGVGAGLIHEFQKKLSRGGAIGVGTSQRVSRLQLSVFRKVAYLFCRVCKFGVASIR